MEPKNKRGRKPNPESKRASGVDRHTKPRKAFHAEQILFDAMEDYRLSSKPRSSETEILITALEEFLERKGFWPRTAKAEKKTSH